MIGFIKKLFGIAPAAEPTPVAEYKVEAPVVVEVAKVEAVNAQPIVAEVAAPAKKPAAKKAPAKKQQFAKKTAAKKAPAKKPVGIKTPK